MVHIENLTFTYSKKLPAPAVDDATGLVGEGITLLLGENGAGKTTLLRLMAGLLIPQRGKIWLGSDQADSPSGRMPGVTSRLFFMPEDYPMPRRSVREFAKSFGCLYPNFSDEAFSANLADFGLTGSERYDSLSLGNRHKSILAFALSLGVDLLLLDEPANGLDITSKATLRRMLARSIGPEQSVVVSTHNVGDLHELYDGLLLMSHGRLLLSTSSWNVTSRVAFTESEIPPRDALYFEQRAGRFHAIRPVTPGEENTTEIDYSLLYSALLSQRGDEILKIIRND